MYFNSNYLLSLKKQNVAGINIFVFKKIYSLSVDSCNWFHHLTGTYYLQVLELFFFLQQSLCSFLDIPLPWNSEAAGEMIEGEMDATSFVSEI
jgi:hypothetical protein